MQNKRIYFKNKLVIRKEKSTSKTINNNINSNEKKHPKNIELNDTIYKKLNSNQKEYQIIKKTIIEKIKLKLFGKNLLKIIII